MLLAIVYFDGVPQYHVEYYFLSFNKYKYIIGESLIQLTKKYVSSLSVYIEYIIPKNALKIIRLHFPPWSSPWGRRKTRMFFFVQKLFHQQF